MVWAQTVLKCSDGNNISKCVFQLCVEFVGLELKGVVESGYCCMVIGFVMVREETWTYTHVLV